MPTNVVPLLVLVIGFGPLSVASLNAIRTFGWYCALGSGMNFLAVITAVPLLASTRLSQYLVTASEGVAIFKNSSHEPLLLTICFEHYRGQSRRAARAATNWQGRQ